MEWKSCPGLTRPQIPYPNFLRRIYWWKLFGFSSNVHILLVLILPPFWAYFQFRYFLLWPKLPRWILLTNQLRESNKSLLKILIENRNRACSENYQVVTSESYKIFWATKKIATHENLPYSIQKRKFIIQTNEEVKK